MSRKQNRVPQDGVSWPTQFSVTAGIDDMEVTVEGANDKVVVKATYYGSSSITLANYNGFPVGSIIDDTEVYSQHMKIGATTWKSSTVWS